MMQQTVTDRADQLLVRKLNTSRILNALRINGPMSRASLSTAAGLNRSTVSKLMGELLSDGLVREIGLQSSSGGRPGVLLELNADAGYAVGIELEHRFVTAVLANFLGTVLWHQRIDFPQADSPQVVAEHVAMLAEQADSFGQQRNLRFLGIGLGAPGLLDIHEGQMIFSTHQLWQDFRIPEKMIDKFGDYLLAENAANAAALGEYYFGAERGVENLLYVNAGVSLDSGIIINGELVRGGRGYAGGIGHLTAIPHGELCSCGKRGCLQTVAGLNAIVREAQELAAENQNQLTAIMESQTARIDLPAIVQAAHMDDTAALSLLTTAGVQLGIGISNMVNLLNPELVVFGGEMGLAAPFLLPIIEQTIKQYTMPSLRDNLRLRPSTHGPDAGVMGSVALVLDRVFKDPILSA
jgi:predicted NBD/HSP70 family sugar kinase